MMNFLILGGAVLGLFLGGWHGMLLGAVIGYFIAWFIPWLLIKATLGKIQSQFLESTFAVMGAMCKVDGQVTAEEIRVAEQLFDQLKLVGEARAAAKQAFQRGKTANFDVDAEVRRFARASRGQRALRQMFLQVQLLAIAADGELHPAEHQLLLRIAKGLGLSPIEVEKLEALMRNGRRSGGDTSTLAAAYGVLGVAPTATDAEVKTRYRKLMSQNHPDKLAAKGLPESMRPMAEQKTREISAAYELVKESRGKN